MHLLKKVLIASLASVLGVAVVGVASVYGVWFHEINSVLSIKELSSGNEENKEGKVFEMNVSGGYYFEDFLKKGASNDAELIDYIVSNITKGVIPVKMTPPTIGCSSFTGIDKDTNNHLFGRNYDMIKTSAMIVKTSASGKRHATISTADLTYIGLGDGNLSSIVKKATALAACYAPLDGINDQGVSCGIFMSYQGVKDETGKKKVVATDQKTEKIDLTSTTMLRMILDYADDVESAIDMVKKYDLHDSATTSFHYMIADKKGNSAILEWVNGTSATDDDGSKRELRVYRNTDSYPLKSKDEKFQWITNFLVTPDYYSSEDEMTGYDRYTAIHDAINKDGNNSEGRLSYSDALDILKMVGRRNWGKSHKQNADSITPWSALYDLDDLSLTWVGNENFDDPSKILRYSLKK